MGLTADVSKGAIKQKSGTCGYCERAPHRHAGDHASAMCMRMCMRGVGFGAWRMVS